MLRENLLRDWNLLSEDLQILLSTEALRRAADAVAQQAEALAIEIEAGVLADRGGPDALRLLAALMREASHREPAMAGTA